MSAIPASTTKSRTLNRSELAAFHGVTPPTVDSWIARGCPAVARGSKGREWRFDSAAVIDWRLRQAASDAATGLAADSGVMSREEADRRRAVANATVAEVEAHEALEAVVAREDVEVDVASFCQALHTGLGNACSKIAARTVMMGNAAEIEGLCHVELNRAFQGARASLGWGKSG